MSAGESNITTAPPEIPITNPIGFIVPVTDLDISPQNNAEIGGYVQAPTTDAPAASDQMSKELVVPAPNGTGTVNGDDPNSAFDMNQGVHFRKQKKPVAFNRHISMQPSIGAQSIRSSHSEHDPHAPPPSTDKEKWKHTRRFFATVTALCYCIFLVIFGTVAYVGDAVSYQYPLAEAYSITILGIGFIYFLFLYIDIRIHVATSKKAMKERERRQELLEAQQQKVSEMYQTNPGAIELAPNGLPNGNYQANIQLPEWNVPAVKAVSHKYCFATGRHGEFFYLKLGAAWFCFGLLIHSVLIITYQIIYLTSDDPIQQKCASVLRLVFDFLFPTYSLFLLFFIFKYANVIINERRGLARLCLMHAIGTSLAFWVFTIVRETSDAIRLKQYGYNETEAYAYWSSKEKFQDLDCDDPTQMNAIYRNFAPYLYPFVIEFCILIVGIFYMIFGNINKCPKRVSAPGHDHSHDIYDTAETIPGSGLVHDHDHTSEHAIGEESNHGHQHHHHNAPTPYTAMDGSLSEHSDHCRTTVDHDNEYKSNLIIHADCHRANRGLFAGLILVVCTMAFIILFFVATANTDYFYIGWLTNTIFELVVLAIMIVAVVFAYWQISHLDVNAHPMSKLDDVLLLIAIPAFFLETIFSMVPAIYYGTGLNVAISMCQLVQIMIQTPFIIDGLRRCSNAKRLRRKKPGRELVTFLTIANVSLWLFYTFSVKTAYTGDERYEYYGDVLWSILNHLSLPLIMFYRFHASVCLVDIWRHAYEPGGH